MLLLLAGHRLPTPAHCLPVSLPPPAADGAQTVIRFKRHALVTVAALIAIHLICFVMMYMNILVSKACVPCMYVRTYVQRRYRDVRPGWGHGMMQ